MDNLTYLFWAHAICWIVLFLYFYGLVRKVERLRKELEGLKEDSQQG